MRTIRTKVYKFDELSKAAQQKAIDTWRNDGVETQYYWDEAHESIKKFHEIFGTEEGRNSWLEVRTGHIEDAILELKGLRLHKYLINNFWEYIYKGKYYSLWSKKDISYKYYKNGYPVLKTRYSKVLFNNSCVLTGVCHDQDLLDPIYNFIEKFMEQSTETTFEDLIKECFYSLEKSLNAEDEYRNSDEAIREDIEATEYEFTSDGRRI